MRYFDNDIDPVLALSAAIRPAFSANPNKSLNFIVLLRGGRVRAADSEHAIVSVPRSLPPGRALANEGSDEP